jgi:hypothetical protein
MRFPRRVAVTIPMAVLLAVVLAGQTVGAAWSAKTVIDRSSVWLADLATFANGTAIALIEDCVDTGGGMCTGVVALRRSTDGGLTWGPRMKVAPRREFDEEDMAAIAGRGKFVDLVWGGDGLRYRRSINQGETFGRARYLSHASSVRHPDIGRGPDGLVAVSWGGYPDDFTDQISVRVSSDGGRTFGTKHSWPTTTADWSTVAVGDGVVYLASINAAGKEVVRRSTNAGQSWSLISQLDPGGLTLAAEGSEAYVAWISPQGQGVKYRRTIDRGATWSPVASLSSPNWYLYDTVISLQGGVARALYGGDDGMYYRQSADGLTWSAPRIVSQQPYGFVGRAGDRVLVLFHNGIKTFVKTRPL